MSDDVALGRGREFDLIRLLRQRWGALAEGIGDDAAELPVPRGDQLLASTDAAVENVHFVRAWVSLEAVGYRAVTAALSDLAAMAARPAGVLVSLQLPSPFDDADLAALADGIGGAVRAVGTVIRGGNIAAADQLSITTTVLGTAHAPLRRSAARPGDFLYVTGALGAPAAAVRRFAAGVDPDPALRSRFEHPVARIREAEWLAARGAVAAIDISDGLGGDADHLATASGVALDLDLDRVPLVPGVDPDDVFGGEEYELLLASRMELPAAEFTRRFDTPLSLVGRVREGSPSVTFSRRGARVAAPAGYDHLSS